VLAQIIVWHHEIPLGEGDCGDNEAMDICFSALEACRLDQLLGTIRAGGYEVRRRGESFRVRHRWNPAVEAADMFLEQATAPAVLPELTPVESAWVKGRPKSSRVLPPPEVLHAAAQRAGVAIATYRRALPEGTLTDSFKLDDGPNVGDAVVVLSFVMGFASLCEHAARLLKRTEVTVVNIGRGRLLDMITELWPDLVVEHVDAVIDRLTYLPGRSCRVSPLSAFRRSVISGLAAIPASRRQARPPPAWML
jgi:hypothetical protein